ncbi:MAG: hypothetical protein K0U93_10665 [Gammaproteobacteria bacterium]|nr:hypothetical protein [Gammaproteobacteria bacterium]
MAFLWLGLGPLALADSGELSRNSIFDSWAHSPVGERIVVEKTERAGERTQRSRLTFALLSRTPNAATVEMTIEREHGDSWKLIERTESTVPSLIDAKAAARQRIPPSATKRGRETIDVVGLPIEAQWFTLSKNQLVNGNDVRVDTRTSFSDAVPGRTIRVEQQVYRSGTTDLVYTATTRVVEWSPKRAE